MVWWVAGLAMAALLLAGAAFFVAAVALRHARVLAEESQANVNRMMEIVASREKHALGKFFGQLTSHLKQQEATDPSPTESTDDPSSS